MQLSESLNSFQEQLTAKLGRAEKKDADLTDAPTLARIAALIEKITGYDAQDVDPSHTTSDLGMGSLDRIELMVRVEDMCGVRIDDAAAADLTTVGDLADYVDEQTADC